MLVKISRRISESETIDRIKVHDITVTMVCEKYPRKLMKHLKEERHLQIEKVEDGIYYVKGDLFPIQILCTANLSDEENLWLKSLTDKLTEVNLANKLLKDYKDKEKDMAMEELQKNVKG